MWYITIYRKVIMNNVYYVIKTMTNTINCIIKLIVIIIKFGSKIFENIPNKKKVHILIIL